MEAARDLVEAEVRTAVGRTEVMVVASWVEGATVARWVMGTVAFEDLDAVVAAVLARRLAKQVPIGTEVGAWHSVLAAEMLHRGLVVEFVLPLHRPCGFRRCAVLPSQEPASLPSSRSPRALGGSA